jgi:hypothetical protein
MDEKELASGWAFDEYGGGPFHFKHVPLVDAEKLAEVREALYVLETVNWTLADDSTVHHNLYFAFGLASAIALAARMEIEWQDVAEDLVAIRPATDAEMEDYLKVSRHFHSQMPDAISEADAANLPTSSEE